MRQPPAPFLFGDPNTGRTPPGLLDRARPPRLTARVVYGEGTAAGTTGGGMPGTSGTLASPPGPGGDVGGSSGSADGCCS